MNINLHTRSTQRWSNQGKLQSSRNFNKLELKWYDNAIIHSHKEYNKSILKPVMDHSNLSNALLFHSLHITYIKPKGTALHKLQIHRLHKFASSNIIFLQKFNYHNKNRPSIIINCYIIT